MYSVGGSSNSTHGRRRLWMMMMGDGCSPKGFGRRRGKVFSISENKHLSEGGRREKRNANTILCGRRKRKRERERGISDSFFPPFRRRMCGKRTRVRREISAFSSFPPSLSPPHWMDSFLSLSLSLSLSLCPLVRF